jgi:hypothetical protein
LLRRDFVHLTGIDYSEKSIELARTQLGSQAQFKVIDMTSTETSTLENYDIAIDKGTLDAILLCSSDERANKCQAYVNTVYRHVNSLLFLISCNWTRNELVDFFQTSNFCCCYIYTE